MKDKIPSTFYIKDEVAVSLRTLLVIISFLLSSYTIFYLNFESMIIVNSFILSGFVNAGHDCVHRLHFKSRKINDFFGLFWCTFVLIDFYSYKNNHMAHHKNTGNNKDPEGKIFIYSIKDYINLHLPFFFHISIAKRVFNFNLNTLSLNIIRIWLIISISATIFHPILMTKLYWIPLLIYPSFVIFFSLPEHYGLYNEVNYFKKSRNIKSNVFFEYFQWNANYHADHHIYPGVPSTKLKNLNSFLEIQTNTEKSYIKFHIKLLRGIYEKERS